MARLKFKNSNGEWVSLEYAIPAKYMQSIEARFAEMEGNIATALPIAGGTMTGELVLASDPTSAMHAVTKQYVDSLIGAILNGAS